MVWTAREGRAKQSYHNHLKEVAGCVPIYHDAIYMISSRTHPEEWILPKGGRDVDESLEDAALREAAEEAGLRGTLSTRLYTNVTHNTESHFFELHVTEVLNQWPEDTFRRRQLVSMDEALTLCRRPDMVKAIQQVILLRNKSELILPVYNECT
jgi:diphosphoinositol-polyphosphate diphosphatase